MFLWVFAKLSKERDRDVLVEKELTSFQAGGTPGAASVILVMSKDRLREVTWLCRKEFSQAEINKGKLTCVLTSIFSLFFHQSRNSPPLHCDLPFTHGLVLYTISP